MCRPFGDPNWVTDTAKRLGLERTVRPRGRPKKSEACHGYLYSLCSQDLVAVTFHPPRSIMHRPKDIEAQVCRDYVVGPREEVGRVLHEV